MSEDELEEEFRKLTRELSEDENLKLDNDEYHLDGGKLCVALVLAPMDNAPALEAILKLLGTTAKVVSLNPWAAVWMEVNGESSDEEDLAALLTGNRNPPQEVDEVARTVSKLSKYGSVAVISWLSENAGFEPGVSGQVTAKRYIAGQPEDDLSAGLLLNSLDTLAEDLLLGRVSPDQLDDNDDDDGGWKKFFRRPRKNN